MHLTLKRLEALGSEEVGGVEVGVGVRVVRRYGMWNSQWVDQEGDKISSVKKRLNKIKKKPKQTMALYITVLNHASI